MIKCTIFDLGELANLDGIVRINKGWRQRDKKEKDPIFQQAKKFTTLKINQLKELITNTISNHDYIDLQFGQSERDKFMIINFTSTDNKDDRKESDSTNTLRTLIMSTLETANW